MASEQFSLCWDNFHKNMAIGMNSLLESEDLVDVTIGVEGRYIKAHKMVLSVCSPYFRELFKVNPCKHPIVVLKDVSYVAMADLLQFMYQGEVQVSQESLSTFIKTAEALQIKGLTGENNHNENYATDSVKDEILTPKQNLKAKKPHTAISQQAGKRAKLISTVHIAPQNACVAELGKPNRNSDQVIIGQSETEDEQKNRTNVPFKLEPYEQVTQIMSVDDDGDEDDEDVENVECYPDDSIMNDSHDMKDNTLDLEDEPKPGTSSDMELVKREGQGSGSKPKKRLNRMRFVADGFVYHNNVIAGSPPLRYLGCAEHRKAGCRGRATIPVGGNLNQLKMTQQHNHPPDINAEEKYSFIKELKVAVQSNALEKVTLKHIYDTVAALYPKAAAEILFRNISSSLHRWRKDDPLLE